MNDSTAQAELKLTGPSRFYGGGRGWGQERFDERLCRPSRSDDSKALIHIFLAKAYQALGLDFEPRSAADDWMSKKCWTDIMRRRMELRVANYDEWISDKSSMHMMTGLPQVDQHRNVLEAENLKTQLIAERRNALLSARRESRLLEATEDLSTAVKNLTEAQGTLLSAATAKAEGRVCLHEQYVGTVSELIGSQVVVVYESKEGNPIKQFYDRDQFVEDYAPLEGETLYAFVFIAAATSRPSLQEPGSMEAEDFSGFRTSSVEGDIEL